MEVDSSGSLAWLFQYKAREQNDWIANRESTHEVNWRIIRWARETKVGDVVFFWQAGNAGGLRGWGRISRPPYAEGERTR